MKKLLIGVLLVLALLNASKGSEAQQAVGPTNLQVSGAVGNGKALSTSGLNVTSTNVTDTDGTTARGFVVERVN